MIESRIAGEWACAAILADGSAVALASGGVWNGRAPAGCALPYVLASFSSGWDVNTLSGVRVLSPSVLTVRAVGLADDAADVASLADRIDAVLASASGTASGGTVYGCVREGPYERAYSVENLDFLEIGGRYRIVTQAT